jgi:DNA-binding LacI/PurR family transcriptional regulator
MTLAMQLGSEAGVLAPGLEYFVEILTAASASALELGYGFVLAPTGASVKSLQGLAIDGAVVVDPTGDEALFERTSTPIVTTGRVPGDAGTYSWVDNNHLAGTRLVLDHFTEIGCSRPALLTTSVQPSYVEDAVTAYLDWCTEHDLEPIVEQIVDSTNGTDAVSTVDELLSRRPRPDAIYTTLDRVAVGVLLACHGREISVPQDLAVASTTDSQFLRSANPPVTALNLNAPEIGRRAAELLIRQIEEDEPPKHVVVPSSLITRASTRKAGPTDSG